ncbi:hypothetical protein ABZR86_02050 [Dyella marensis]|uniref:Uncharacterized protein n=1 Tax=Dyella marensis TaxID=500610 RepID=A0A1I2A962_9GAMM|nr:MULTISPECIES: hypothetical protein [Dyella]SFE40279.1 hypothetical protein SAMN02799615_00961 [Dyella marensis]
MHLNAASPIGGGLKGMTRDLDSYIQRREQAYQQATPDTAGSYIGAGVGETLPWLTGIGELRALGVLPKATTYLGKLGTLATEGALIGASQPVTSGPQNNLQDLVEGKAPTPSYADQKALQIGFGAATGPLMKVGLDTGGLLGGGVKNAVQHITNPSAIANANVARMTGNNPVVAGLLRSAPQLVPGESPSVAQVLQTPEAV